MKKYRIIILNIILILICIFMIKIFWNNKEISNISGINTGDNTISGDNIDINSGIIAIFEKDIITGFSLNKINKTLNDYPKIIVKESLISAKLVAEIDFTERFKNKYQYENSKSYYFALKFFLGDFNNGGYYEVFRGMNNGVANSSKQGLNGAKLAYLINGGTEREIDLSKVRIAVEGGKATENYGYKYFYGLNYLNSNLNKEIPIGVYLSSTKEIKGRNLTYIKNLKIVYYGKKDSIEVVP